MRIILKPRDSYTASQLNVLVRRKRGTIPTKNVIAAAATIGHVSANASCSFVARSTAITTIACGAITGSAVISTLEQGEIPFQVYQPIFGDHTWGLCDTSCL